MTTTEMTWTKVQRDYDMIDYVSGDRSVCTYIITRFSGWSWSAHAEEGYFGHGPYRPLGIHRTLKAAKAAVAEHAAKFAEEGK